MVARRALGLALAGAGVALVVACASEKKVASGGLMLIVVEDGPLALDRLHIEVASRGAVLKSGDYRLPSEATLPTTLAIASNGDPTTTVAITVAGYRGAVPLDRRDQIVEQVPVDRVAALTVMLSARCTPLVRDEGGVATSLCPTEQTCSPVSGACVSSHVSAGDLPTYLPDQELDASGGATGDATPENDAGGGDGSVGVTCGPTEKRCGGGCVSVLDPAFGCGATSCSPCSVDPVATYTCLAQACKLAGCAAGTKECGGKCVSVDDPAYGCGATGCAPAACPDAGAGTVICQGGACVVGDCSATTKACNGKCVPKDRNNGCASTSCGACGASEVCSGTPSVCTCVPDRKTPCNAKSCGPAVDNCGATFTCDDLCAPIGKVCTGNSCSCAAEPLATTCAGKACGPATNNCGDFVVCPNTCAGQLCGVGGPNTCGFPPSCNTSGGHICGMAQTDDCCASPLVTGGSFSRFADNRFPGTVSSFRLDKYEVTVERFREFVYAWVGGWRPTAGSGKHLHVRGGSGAAILGAGASEGGWTTAFETGFPTSLSDWTTKLACSGGGSSTWSESPNAIVDRKPINCASWAEAYAFCIWDGGFLPTVAEWNYAASGGSEYRMYPWGAGIDATYAKYCLSGSCGGDIPIKVGSYPSGVGKWGQLDLAGNVSEWVLDHHTSDDVGNTCVDCTEEDPVIAGINYDLGGAYWNGEPEVTTTHQGSGIFKFGRNTGIGFRCARLP